VLYCVECGCCSGELGKGWVAYRCDDPDPDQPYDGRPIIAFYCPACATREFGYRPDVGATYVCSWEPRPEQATESVGYLVSQGQTASAMGSDTLAHRLELSPHAPPTVRPGMEPARAFSVTMVRPGVMPSFEVGLYEYFGRGLPLVGETILLRRTEGPEAGAVLQGYVTRVNPSSDTPIAVTEVAQASGSDQPGGPG
jgi:hypothetical protein